MVLKKSIILGVAALLLTSEPVFSHCQMPCGIYHDDMVYDMIDQYVETMYKAITELNANTITSPKDKNQYIRWVMLKEKASDDTANLVTTYFMQQKIKPDDPESTKMILAAHKLLFYTVAIKQNIDLAILKQFSDEWDKFKLMFHIEGYECKMEQRKLKERQAAMDAAAKKKAEEPVADNDHDHGHDHDHDHGDHDHPHTH